MTEPRSLRVVIAEDATLFREGLVRLLADRGHRVVAAVADADALLAAVAEHDPDVAVADIRMPPTHTDEGLRAAIELRRDHPRTGVLMLSQYIETKYAARLLAGNAPASGTCSRTGLPTWPNSPTRWPGWRAGAPRSTRRWSASSSGPAVTPTAWPR